jgi:hypothetical protein
MTPVALGFRAGRGGSVVVGVAVDRPLPRVVLSVFLATAADGDRLAFEPYQVAYEMPRAEGGGPTAEAAAVVAEGRRRQAALASSALAGVLRGRRPRCGRDGRESLHESAMLKLPLSPGQIDVQLNALGATVGRPWRKEQKAACLAAWVAATGL